MSMQKFLVTGGSGFIGTNVVEYLVSTGKYEVLNIDSVEPKNDAHRRYWKNVNICDKAAVVAAVTEFNPTYVLHLAARTDLMGASVEDYDANVTGVENMLCALDGLKNLKRAVFTSSMLVCRVGYIPTHDEDYSPSTFYGESKVKTEAIIKAHNPAYCWSIIRPTSIWGPWFGVPYANFFKMILAHTYVNMGKKACTKTYGYIDNAVYQIMALFTADEERVNGNVYYIGDYEPYNISEWAKEVGKEAGVYIPTVPFFLLQAAAFVGDVLKKIHIPFPMTSFRLKNMTTDNVVNTENIREIAPHLPVSRVEGVARTVKWLREQKKK